MSLPKKRLETIEMQFYNMIIRIPRTESAGNEKVLIKNGKDGH